MQNFNYSELKLKHNIDTDIHYTLNEFFPLIQPLKDDFPHFCQIDLSHVMETINYNAGMNLSMLSVIWL